VEVGYRLKSVFSVSGLRGFGDTLLQGSGDLLMVQNRLSPRENGGLCE